MSARPQLRIVPEHRLAGLVTRVSTDGQSRNDEGSLKTQLQRLRQHIEYKTSVAGEDWTEAAVYELKAISGKDSMRSVEFERLFADIRVGRINTILCTSLDRICRSVRDFLHFFEVLSEHGVEFVCLKQNYDTTSPQGKLFVTIMMALAEFEREQTAERTRDAVAARAERGLWNGGRLLGYDLDANHKGYLIPNQSEVMVVNYAFDTYLECGSIAETVSRLNARGYRTKSFTSRREIEHPGHPFAITSIQHVLKNVAYVGKKVIGTGPGRRTVPAVWPGIVEPAKFERVQLLMASNSRSNHSGAAPVKHAHLLARGLLACGRCGSQMQGRSGTGHLKTTYYYYACASKDCCMRVVAGEIEDEVLSHLGSVASDPAVVSGIVENAAIETARQLAHLARRLRTEQRDLKSVRAKAARLLTLETPDDADARSLITDQLRELATRREQLERASRATEDEIQVARGLSITPDAVRDGLSNFKRVYAHLRPFEQRDLIHLLIRHAELHDTKVVLELYENACASFAQASKSDLRFEATKWLPDEDSNLEHRG